MHLSDWLENKVKLFLNETVDTMVGYYQDELQRNEDYRGRQLLELLQNADDAYSLKQSNHKAYIELTNTQLIIKNTGIGFSKEGVESLLTSNLSPKDNNYIGNKGLGFRSILNWAKKVHIYSNAKEDNGVWSFVFSRNSAIERFNTLGEERKKVARKKAQNDEQFPIAILRCPKWEVVKADLEDYTTIITIDLKDNIEDDIIKQLNKINENILVFLPHLLEIELSYEDKVIIYKKINNPLVENINEVIIEKQYGDEITQKHWTVHHKSGKIITKEDGQEKEKDYNLAVAYQDDLSDIANHLFSFFPTQIPLHIPALVHGTFDLEGNRNKISATDANKKLLKKLVDLLLKTSKYIAKENKYSSWKPLSLLYLENRDDERLNELGFYEHLANQIKTEELFPCHDGKYHTLKNTQLINNGNNFDLHDDIHNILSYERFEILPDILRYTVDSKIHKLIGELSDEFIYNDDIAKELNGISEPLTEDERVDIIGLVAKHKNFAGNNNLDLLVDDEGEVLKSNISVYTPKTQNTLNFKIPRHVNLRFMSESLYIKLVDNLSSSFRRGVEADSRKLKNVLDDFINLHSYEPDPVIKKIISDTDVTNIDQIKNMTQTLYTAYSSVDIKPQTLTTENIPLIDKNKDIIFSKELYLGEPYPNGDFIENIYSEVEVLYLADPEYFGLTYEPDLEDFFKWLGVNQYIKHIKLNIKDSVRNSYIEWFKKHTNFQYKFQGGTSSFEVDASSVEHIKEVFKTNTIEDILYWLKISDGLNYVETTNIKFLVGANRTNKTNATEKDKELYSYFQWDTEGLIPTKSGNNSSPFDCMLPELNLNLSPIFETVEVDYKKVEELGVERGEAKDILHGIGIYRDFDEISKDKIKNILENLHILDPDGKQAKKIYRLILKRYTDYKSEEVNRIALKCSNIKVFCKKGDRVQYFSSSEARYLDENIYPKAILKNYPLIDIATRQGQSKINHIFDVEPLKDLKIILDTSTSKENNLNIQDDIDSVKPYILALRLRQLEGKDQSRPAKALKRMKVKLMSKLIVTIEGQTIPLEEYDYIYENNTFYVCTNLVSLDELRQEIGFIDLITTLFSTALKVSSDESKYKEIYKDKYNRKHILHSHTENEADRYLELAKDQLEIFSNRLEFWNDIARLYGYDETILKTTDINKFFNIDIDIDIEIINYDNLSADQNYAIFKIIFSNISTLEEFNKKSILNIDFTDFYKRKLLSEAERIKPFYQFYIWNQLKDASESKQKKLGEKWKILDEISFCDIENDLDIDIEKYFAECFLKITGIHLNDLISLEEIDYTKDYFSFMENKDEDLLQQLWKSINESLSYFEKNHQRLNEIYNNLKKESEEDDNISLVDEINPVEIEIEIEIPEDILYTPPITPSGSPGGSVGGGQVQRDETGLKGERIVYKELLKNNENVQWVSHNAKKAGVNPDGRDGDGYDITYWDKDGIQYFIEVKSTKNETVGKELIFYMSKNEYEVAQQKKELFKIYYVVDVNSHQPRILKFTFNDKDIKKDVKDYRITTKPKYKDNKKYQTDK